MKSVVRLALVDPNDASRSSLKSMLLGIETVWLEAECSSYEYFEEVVSQTQPDMALICLDANAQVGLDVVAKLHENLPSCAILCVSSSQEGSLILQAMRNGAKEFLSFPLKREEFLAALNRIRHAAVSGEGEGAPASNHVIAVAGVSGGVGCTSLAINIACSLAQNEDNHVAIIDLDMALGDADVWLDIIPDYTIQDVIENITRLDYSLLKRSLTKHDCGVFLLPRPVKMESSLSVSDEEMRRVIALLKATFSHLVLDVSKTYGQVDLAAINAADTVLLTSQLDLPCLRNVVRLLQAFEEREGLSEKTKVVINRLGLEDTQISLAKAQETIGRDIFAQIPNDYATMVEARNNGVPLIVQSPKSKLSKAIEQLVRSLEQGTGDASDLEGAKQRKGLFSFLGSGTK